MVSIFNIKGTPFITGSWLILAVIACAALMGCGRYTPDQAPAGVHPNAQQVSDTTNDPWTPSVWTAFVANGPTGKHLPDFSYAGYAMGDRPLPHVTGPLFDVSQQPFGAVVDDGIDDTAAIQAAIDEAGAAGGGVVYLPKGRYDIHATVDTPFLRISRDRVVLRGQGSGADGTILHLGAPAPAKRVRRLGSVAAREEARHGAVVAVMGTETRQALASYTKDVHRGGRVIGVSDTTSLTAGQTVVIEFTDPLIDPQHPTPEKADLVAQLTAPYRLIDGQRLTFGAVAKKHTWIVRIREIADGHTIRLTKPARFDQWHRYQPRLYSFEGVRQVGIEHLRIQSSWPGGYRHHKAYVGTDGAIVRTAKEQDYLWNGIWISSAVDGWVRDVAFKDLTQGIIATRCAQITLKNIQFLGQAGHAGVTIAHSNDILVTGADFQARLVHPVTVKNMAAGNVVSDCRTHYDDRDAEDETDTVIDFHGLFPYENLFEALADFYVCPGGDLSVHPHAGVRNVFWNIQAPLCMACFTDPADSEFARSEGWVGTSSVTPATMFEHWPQAFYIGIRRKEGLPLTVGGSTMDRGNEWMTVEGLNRPHIAIPSLYQAQLNRRRLLSIELSHLENPKAVLWKRME